jgi:ubiquinol-cytochrome c reductase cytochrome b subunit
MISYGRYLRALHYLSGQCFLIFTLIHVLECFWKERYRTIPSWDWLKLLVILPLAFLLVLTGFILKGDKEGLFAAGVMFNLAREIPVIGTGVAQLVLRPGDDFFLLPYLHHVVILPIIVLMLLVQHRKRFMPKGDMVWPVLAALSLLAIFYPLPPDIPPHQARALLAGPWFFQGIQLLLRYVPPFWAGIAWPLLPLILTASLAFCPVSRMRWLRAATAITWAAHGALIVLAWAWLPRLGG